MARRLIVGEENSDISSMLHDYFEERGFHVQSVESGPALLDAARTAIPNVLLVSASLPETDPNTLVEQLRGTPRISHVPIICLAPRGRYTQLLSVLEHGADDCVAKPFDLEELALRIENAMQRSERENVVDPRSGLPGSRLLEDHLDRMADSDGWHYVDLKIEHFEPFREVNGFVAADQVLNMMPGLLRDVVLAHGTDRDFLSHPADDHFVLVTFSDDPEGLAADLAGRFAEAAQTHYAFMDREMGFLTVQRGEETLQVPLMTLSTLILPPDELYSESVN